MFRKAFIFLVGLLLSTSLGAQSVTLSINNFSQPFHDQEGSPAAAAKWAILIDTQKNGFAAGAYKPFDVSVSGQFLSTSEGQSDDYFVFGDSPLLLGSMDSKSGYPSGVASVVQLAWEDIFNEGQAFAVIWFPEGAGSAGSAYGLARDSRNNAQLPGAGNTSRSWISVSDIYAGYRFSDDSAEDTTSTPGKGSNIISETAPVAETELPPVQAINPNPTPTTPRTPDRTPAPAPTPETPTQEIANVEPSPGRTDLIPEASNEDSTEALFEFRPASEIFGFNGVLSEDSDWLMDPAFSPVYTFDQSPWAYFSIIGWSIAYLPDNATDGLWFYIAEASGWYWTTRSTFPYAIDAESLEPIYFYRTESSAPLYIFDFETEMWREASDK